MKNKKSILSASMAALCVLSCPAAFAEDSTGWYAGGDVGRSSATIANARISAGLAGAGLATTSIADRDRSTAYQLYGGYKVNQNFALEGGYVDLGKFGFTANTSPAGTLNGDIRLRGVNLDAVGIWPVTDRFSVLGRVGVASLQARDSFSGTGAVGVTNPNPSKRDTNYKVGVGVEYAMTDRLGLRAGVERFRVNDAVGNKGHIDLVSVGLVYHFGPKPQPLAPRAAMVEPVQMAASPAPVYIAPPAPVPVPPRMPVKVSFAADSLFDFDKSAVKPDGKLALDKFAAELKGTQYDAIKVTGHTDRLGSHAYNLKLSARRAEAVSAYLVETAGIAPTRISASGVDGADPVTKPGDCIGNKPTPKLIACLQPDRRVEVEVTGTR